MKICYALFFAPYMSGTIGNLILRYAWYSFFLQFEVEYYLSPVFNFLISCRLFHKYRSDTYSIVNQQSVDLKKGFDSCHLLRNPG